MAIGGIEGSGTVFRPEPAGSRPAEEAKRREAPQATAVRPEALPAAAAAQDDGAVPIEAPPGTDPVLWSVLTAEERRHFAKLQALGPLTYGPRPAPATPPAQMRGGRIDLTV